MTELDPKAIEAAANEIAAAIDDADAGAEYYAVAKGAIEAYTRSLPASGKEEGVAVVNDVVNLIRAAWELCDSTEGTPIVGTDGVMTFTTPTEEWDKLSAALDRLDMLPDPPGLFAGPATKASHALAALTLPVSSVPSSGEGWRTIDTAKQDIKAPDILLYHHSYDQIGRLVEYHAVGRWVSCTGPNGLLDGWEDHEGVHPEGFFTHWKPLDAPALPAAPKAEGKP